MTESSYRPAPFRAESSLDAIDIAKRRARDDGFVVKTVATCKRDALGRWAVCLSVTQRPG